MNKIGVMHQDTPYETRIQTRILDTTQIRRHK